MKKPKVHCAGHHRKTALNQPTLLKIHNKVMKNRTNDNDDPSKHETKLLFLILNVSLIKVKMYVCGLHGIGSRRI